MIDLILTSYDKCYVYVDLKRTTIKAADLQKVANQLMLNGALVIYLSVKARKSLVV